MIIDYREIILFYYIFSFAESAYVRNLLTIKISRLDIEQKLTQHADCIICDERYV